MQPFQEIITSKPFTFVIGTDKQEFLVYSAAVSKYSDVLERMMNCGMQETAQQKAALPDTDPDVFASFIQFCYSSDYFDPEIVDDGSHAPKQAESESKAPARRSLNAIFDDTESDVDFDIPEPISSSKKDKLKKGVKRVAVTEEGNAWNSFIQAQYSPTVSCETFKSACQLRLNRNSTMKTTPILLHHAALFVFAERYDVKALQQLVMYKVHRCLKAMKGMYCEAESVLDLVRYVYSEANANLDMTLLKREVVDYIVARVATIKANPRFSEMTEGTGAFAHELLSAFLRAHD